MNWLRNGDGLESDTNCLGAHFILKDFNLWRQR